MNGHHWRSPKVRRPREAVAPLIEAIREALLDDNPAVEFEYEFCGSWRRECQLVGDVDVLLLSRSPLTPHLFDGGLVLPELPGMSYQRRGPRLAAAEVVLPDGGTCHVDYWQFPFESRGCALLALTGPAAYNRACRVQAARCRPSLSLSQQALKYRDTGEVIHVPDERAVLAAIGMPYETPAQRERWAQ